MWPAKGSAAAAKPPANARAAAGSRALSHFGSLVGFSFCPSGLLSMAKARPQRPALAGCRRRSGPRRARGRALLGRAEQRDAAVDPVRRRCRPAAVDQPLLTGPLRPPPAHSGPEGPRRSDGAQGGLGFGAGVVEGCRASSHRNCKGFSFAWCAIRPGRHASGPAVSLPAFWCPHFPNHPACAPTAHFRRTPCPLTINNNANLLVEGRRSLRESRQRRHPPLRRLLAPHKPQRNHTSRSRRPERPRRTCQGSEQGRRAAAARRSLRSPPTYHHHQQPPPPQHPQQ
jgi:hypothetical protein